MSAPSETSIDLLEREAELAGLGACVSAAGAGHGVTVLVRAPSGLGKSSLIAAAREVADGAGFDTLRARGSELERDFPLGVAVQLFESRLRAATDPERAELLAGSARLAAPLFEGEQLPGDTEPPGDAAMDFSLLHGLHWLAANLSERQPLALLVDDAHWADRLSLRFLLYLTERIADLPILVVVAARPDEPGADAELLAELAGHPSTVLLQPAPLGAESAEHLTTAWIASEQDVDSEFTSACHEVTGGNPLLLRELLAALNEEGVPPIAASVRRVREIGPEPVSRAIYLGLRRLGGDATALARAVAVLGYDAELVVAAELADLGLRAAARAAAALETGRLFAEGPGLGFTHPILGAAVYEELTASERAQAHHLAARILGDQGPLEQVAAHLIASRPSRDPWATVTLRRAAAHARARGAPDAAARYLERALAEPPPQDQLTDVLLELGRNQAAAGLPGAVDTLERALTASGDPARRAAILLDVGRTLYGQGRFAEAAAAFRRGADEAAGDDELKLELESGYAAAGLWDPAQGMKALERLAPLLIGDDAPRTIGQRVVLANVAGLEMLRGDDHRKAIELASRAWGDGAFLEQATADDPSLGAITGALIGGDAFEEAAAIAAAAMEDARRRGSILAFATSSYIRACAHFYAGRLDDAMADAEQAIDANRFGWEAYYSAALWVLGQVLIERGELDRAQRELELSEESERRLRIFPIHATLHHARGRLALERGDAALALSEFEAAGRLARDVLGTSNPGLLAWQSQAALALARLDRRDEAIALAEEEVAAALRYGARRPIGAALRARGIVEGGAGAIPFLEEACSVLDGSPARLEHAHALVTLGLALRRNGKRTASREPLTAGLDLADRCGAIVLSARAHEELVAAGARPRRARVSGPASLTPSERRVAEMAAKGMTNREIAEALFVTRKAVEYHLGNVFRKLDIRGRAELAASLGEPG